MPSLSELTDYEIPAPESIPADIPRVTIDTSEKKTVADSVIDKLLGLNGQERYQLWPEKVVREGLSAAGDAMQQGTIAPGLRREDFTDIPAPDMPTKDSTALGKFLGVAPVAASPQDKLIEQAGAISALAGTGGLAGAEEGAVLNATPSLRPALKYKDKLYKGKPGQEHQDVIPKHLYPEFQQMAMSGEDISHYNFGFVNDKGHFLDRESALKYGIDNGLIDPQAGKYGALTSTLMADSSKPGMAIEAMAKADPFFSALEHNVSKISQNKMNGDAWLGTLSNKPGVKPEELQWTGLKDFLESNKGKLVTKEQIEQHLASNKVELKEVGKADKSNLDPITKYLSESFEAPHVKTSQDIADARKYNTHFKETTKGMSDEEVFSAIEKSNKYREAGDTKYHSYQLPGAENYREMLLTLPNPTKQYNEFISGIRAKYGEGGLSKLPLTEAERAQYNKVLSAAEKVEDSPPYKSSHWDEPNILAHVRMNDRTIDGKKSLHLEEIQSDWHQQGRDKGYASKEKINLTPLMDAQDNTRKAYSKAIEDSWLKYSNGKASNYREARDLLPNEAAIIKSEVEMHQLHDKEFLKIKDAEQKANDAYYEAEAKNRLGVPDAPFKKTWHELALKRMIREAAEKGYDRLSWTPGEAQAARYDLSKSVDSINVKPEHGNKLVEINPKGGRQIGVYVNEKGDVIPNAGYDVQAKPYEGKSLADIVGKETADKILKLEKGQLAGDNLKIGGEGMKGFYDSIIPKSINKLVKEYGAKVETGKTKDGHVIHYVDLPEKLKDTAMSKGFPLFSSTHIFTPISGNPFEENKK